jgi:hypothetical protein
VWIIHFCNSATESRDRLCDAVFGKTTRYYINLSVGVDIGAVYKASVKSAERTWYRDIFQRIVSLCKTLAILRDTGCWRGGPENRVLCFDRFAS